MSERPRPSQAGDFKLDDPGVTVMDPDDSSRPSRGAIHITPELEPAAAAVPVEAPVVAARRGFRWGAVFWAAVGGLILLGVGLSTTRLIEDLFARSEGLAISDWHLPLLPRFAFGRRRRARGVRSGATCNH